MRIKYHGETRPLELTSGKVYEVLSIEGDWYRIMDDTDDDYLYPPEIFDIVEPNDGSVPIIEIEDCDQQSSSKPKENETLVSIDYCFGKAEYSLLKEMIGKTLKGYKCDPFVYSSSVYGLVGLFVDDKVFACTNFIEVADYFGGEEDVARFRVSETCEENVHSQIQNQSMIYHPVNSTIHDIVVVEEEQKLFSRDELSYDVFVTRGLIFELDDSTELSLEKDVWFSETITVSKGYDRTASFASTDAFSDADSWEEGYRGECSRRLVSISEWSPEN